MTDRPPGQDGDQDDADERVPRWVVLACVVVIALVTVVVVVHLAGGGFGGHGAP